MTKAGLLLVQRMTVPQDRSGERRTNKRTISRMVVDLGGTSIVGIGVAEEGDGGGVGIVLGAETTDGETLTDEIDEMTDITGTTEEAGGIGTEGVGIDGIATMVSGRGAGIGMVTKTDLVSETEGGTETGNRTDQDSETEGEIGTGNKTDRDSEIEGGNKTDRDSETERGNRTGRDSETEGGIERGNRTVRETEDETRTGNNKMAAVGLVEIGVTGIGVGSAGTETIVIRTAKGEREGQVGGVI